MVFSDPIFVFAFLPAVWLIWCVLGLIVPGARVTMAWIAAASTVFYLWWDIGNLLVIGGSIAFNFLAAIAVSRLPAGRRGPLLALAIGANLALLGVFKYWGFLTGGRIGLALPLAISFFTFQQISYLVDVSRGLPPATRPLRYAFYVTFFPQLIAGPIVHYREVEPQFDRLTPRVLRASDAAEGIERLTLGLAKKVLIADSLAPLADAVFGASASGATITPGAAWMGAVAFYLQIYFDFSGYCDMAVGLGRLFALRLPENFDRPYLACSLTEFWRRWHITLSSFLRDYLYIPLGGNRRGKSRRDANLMITMLLGGLWHGAGWTFVCWGGLHGLGLIVARALARPGSGWVHRLGGLVLTQAFVLLAWIPFRAETFDSSLRMLGALAGAGGRADAPNTVTAADAAGSMAAALLLPDRLATGGGPTVRARGRCARRRPRLGLVQRDTGRAPPAARRGVGRGPRAAHRGAARIGPRAARRAHGGGRGRLAVHLLPVLRHPCTNPSSDITTGGNAASPAPSRDGSHSPARSRSSRSAPRGFCRTGVPSSRPSESNVS